MWVRLLLCVSVTVNVAVSSAERECVPDRDTVWVSMVGVVQVPVRVGVAVLVAVPLTDGVPEMVAVALRVGGLSV